MTASAPRPGPQRPMLVICCTPLQTLVARAMLDAEQVARFRLIYYTWVDNEKHRRYYDRLAALAEHSAFVHLDSRFPVHWLRFSRALNAVGAREAGAVAFAAINNVYIQHAIHRFRYPRIVTFDDGTANISPRSLYFAPRERGVLRGLGSLALRARKDHRWIRHRSARHYTLYPGLENIVPAARLVPVNLFDARSRRTVAQPAPRRLRIFLGQPLEDVGDPAFASWYRALFERLGIDEYLPHPRESCFPAHVRVVHTPLIAEDYILGRLDEFDAVDVLAVSSTALLNIETDRARRIVVTWPGAGAALRALYPLFERRGCVLASPEQIAAGGA